VVTTANETLTTMKHALSGAEAPVTRFVTNVTRPSSATLIKQVPRPYRRATSNQMTATAAAGQTRDTSPPGSRVARPRDTEIA
jgi:hypothetical protein